MKLNIYSKESFIHSMYTHLKQYLCYIWLYIILSQASDRWLNVEWTIAE